MHRPLQEEEILLPERPVQTEHGPQMRHLRVGCLRVDKDFGRIADGIDRKKMSIDVQKRARIA